jgi:hypothetical protein
MSSADDHPTPLSQQAAEPVEDPPSWHGPVEALDKRVTKLEAAAVVVQAKLESIEQKTDAQTLILSRLDKVTADPKVRAVIYGLLMLFLAWLAKHGIKVETVP